MSDSTSWFNILVGAHAVGDKISNFRKPGKKPQNSCETIFENGHWQIVFECLCYFEASRVIIWQIEFYFKKNQ